MSVVTDAARRALDKAEAEGVDADLITRLRADFDEADRRSAEALLEDMGYDDCEVCQRARLRELTR